MTTTKPPNVKRLTASQKRTILTENARIEALRDTSYRDGYHAAEAALKARTAEFDKYRVDVITRLLSTAGQYQETITKLVMAANNQFKDV